MLRTLSGVVLAALAVVLIGCEGSPVSTPADSSDLALSGKTPTWTVPGDFATIQQAIDDPSVADGDRIFVGPGTFDGATVTKAVDIRARGKAVINDGPLLFAGHPVGGDLEIGFLFPADHSGDGAAVTGFMFEDVEFPVFSRGADGVTIAHNSMASPVQGISNWMGSGWSIHHNRIDGLRSINGGGIGVLIADRLATPGGVGSNQVSHNRIEGTLAVHPNDGGGYDGTGIVLYADFRGGQAGAEAIHSNRVVQNRIALVSDTPSVVDVNAIELTDTRDDDSLAPVIFDNAIGFNDIRRTTHGLALTPDNLADHNEISRNLGHDRRAGSHPSAFGPGGN